jgi:Ca-activated chloride channel family protein
MPRFAALALLSLGLIAPGSQEPQRSVFRVTSETVPVYVTVTDKSGRLAPDLTRDQFQLRDNGKPQALTLFDNTPQPIKLIVMLDVSGSMKGNLPILRAACDQLFAQLRPDDEVKVGTFGNEITIMPAFSHDPQVLRAALPTVIEDAPTPLWRGIDAAMSAFEGAAGRRVVLVLSDGKDAAPLKFGQKFLSVLEVIDRAQHEDVMIYGVGLQSRGMTMGSLADNLPDPALGTLALDTGGGYFEIRPRDDLGAAFAKVADELHHQYLLGFTPPALDGKVHKLEVRITPGDFKPRARKTYLAPKG